MRFSQPHHRAKPLKPCAGSALLLAGLLVATAMPAPTGRADIFHLMGGQTLEGELIDDSDGQYRIRTVDRIVSLPADAVLKIEKAPAPRLEYARRVEQTPDRAGPQAELAAWCLEHGLEAEAKRHYQRVIELDPDHVAARKALGYVRVGRYWVDGQDPDAGGDARATTQPAPATQATRPASTGGRESARTEAVGQDTEELVAAIQGQWMRRIRAIRANRLDSGVDRLVESGREKVLEIHDPLAVLPMVRCLSEGSHAAREVLVQALARFPEDEATMNLAVIALADPAHDIRQAAMTDLKRRNDPRVSAQFREALLSGNDVLIRRAATALGAFGDPAAVPDLIRVLTAERRKAVEVPVRTYFGAYPQVFSGATSVSFGTQVSVKYLPQIGYGAAGGAVFGPTEWQVRDVTMYRTEVLEALRSITGQEFGFDEEAWSRWYEEQTP